MQGREPEGAPDADNAPRIDPETSQGLVSDVCLKRKVRDYIFQSQQEDGKQRHGYDIYVLSGNTLESRQRMAYEHLKLRSTPAETQESEESEKKKTKSKRDDNRDNNIALARTWMCENFFDIRAFGAVMSVNGVQLWPGSRTHPANLRTLCGPDFLHRTHHFAPGIYGRKGHQEFPGHFRKRHTIAYGLYRAHGFINPIFAEIGQDPAKAKGTGFSQEDLDLFWKALRGMFDLDHSAARGLMTPRELVVFKHGSRLGEAPAETLFKRSRRRRPKLKWRRVASATTN